MYTHIYVHRHKWRTRKSNSIHETFECTFYDVKSAIYCLPHFLTCFQYVTWFPKSSLPQLLHRTEPPTLWAERRWNLKLHWFLYILQQNWHTNWKHNIQTIRLNLHLNWDRIQENSSWLNYSVTDLSAQSQEGGSYHTMTIKQVDFCKSIVTSQSSFIAEVTQFACKIFDTYISMQCCTRHPPKHNATCNMYTQSMIQSCTCTSKSLQNTCTEYMTCCHSKTWVL